jgi:hypothetical protein
MKGYMRRSEHRSVCVIVQLTAKRDQNVDSYTGFLTSLSEMKIIIQELTPLFSQTEGLSKN